MGRIVILGTGGTIAGEADSGGQHVGYRAAQIGVEALLAALPPLASWPLEAEQLAQVDSKDMGFALWRALAARVAHHLARPEVAGVVITHGTDTLEETAYFLHRVLSPDKPVVLTAAMRPATALSADGPQNLLDAVRVAGWYGARGVLAVLAGRVHGAPDVRKAHPYRVDAFDSGDAGPIAHVEEGVLRLLRDWPHCEPVGLGCLREGEWPWVEVLTNHAGADGRAVAVLVREGVRGLVVAGTGNASVSAALEAALLQAQASGVSVLLTSRTGQGCVIAADRTALARAGCLSASKARIEILLQLLQAG